MDREKIKINICQRKNHAKSVSVRKRKPMSKLGSTTRAGYLYHEPAFEIDGFSVHRSDNKQRLNVLLRSQSWWNKSVLDLGCNVGYFTIKLALEGARTTGIDTDEDAVAVGQRQVEDNKVENANFFIAEPDHTFYKDKDVLLAFSVLPWVYETEKNPEQYIKKLFTIPVAYVEIQYPPDGRASVPGVVDDASAKAYLEKYYDIVIKLAVTIDKTDGIVRNRTIWKCISKDAYLDGAFKNPIIGSQGLVQMYDHFISKTSRQNKEYSAKEEEKFLKAVEQYDISPKVILASQNQIQMTRIYGVPLSACKTSVEHLELEFEKIVSALDKAGVSHNDVRPGNLIMGNDGSIYLVDFGWATWYGSARPDDVNPVYGGGTDREAFDKILKEYPKWQ